MALGKNLTKKQLIPAADKPKAVSKKTVQPVKKVTTKKETAQNQEGKKKTAKASNKNIDTLQIQSLAPELLQARRELRLRFNQEIKNLKGKEVHLIVFHLGKEEFGININNTREVVVTPEIMKVPGLPRYAPGVVNIRGTIYTLIDLYEKFRLAEKEVEKPYTLLLKNTQIKAGIMVNEVPLTLKISGDQINGIAEVITDLSIDETYIKGIVNLKNRMIFYLDVNELTLGERERLVPTLTSN